MQARVILHHGYTWPVLIRDRSTLMDGITATMWSSLTTRKVGTTSTENEK